MMSRGPSAIEAIQLDSDDEGSASSGTRKFGGRPRNYFRVNHFSEPAADSEVKYNRVLLACKHCDQKVLSRVEDLRDHCLSKCKQISAAARRECEQQVVAKAGPVKRVASNLTRSSKQQKTEPVKNYLYGKLPSTHQVQLNRQLLRWLAVKGIAFDAVESPHFLAWLNSVNPNYSPAGATQLRTTLLTQEFIAVMEEIKNKVAQSMNMTMNLDGWTDNSNNSVYACNLIFPDKSVAQWCCEDFSNESHTANTIAMTMVRWITEIGPERIGAVVTDNAAAMRLARQLTVNTKGLMHILELRCMMHAFSLVMGSMLGHPWAKDVIQKAQRLVTAFQASSKLANKLRGAASTLGLTTTLASSNQTRFTSVNLMLVSVNKHEGAFQQVARQHADILKPELREIISDRNFWSGCETLCKLLEPFSQIITAIQLQSATLADVTRYWLYLAKALQGLLKYLQDDFREHCISAFNLRSLEMNLPICRLALFLDPRYKAAVESTDGLVGMYEKAVGIMQARRYTEEECGSLLMQLQAYRANLPPYDAPLMQPFQARQWWQAIDSKLPIVHLAAFLLDIVPHAAATERLFSLMGWYHSKQRKRMSVQTTGRLTAIKTFHQQTASRVVRKAAEIDQEFAAVEDIKDVAGEVQLEEIAAPERLAGILEQFYHADQQELQSRQDPISYTELLFGDERHGFRLDHAALAVDYVPTTQSAALVSGLGSAADTAFDPRNLVASALGS